MAVLERTFDPAGLADPAAAPALRRLGGLLGEVGYDEHAAARAVVAPSPEHLLSNTARHAFFSDLRRPDGPQGEASLLTSLFVLNRSIPDEWVVHGLSRALLGSLEELALLDRSAGRCRARVSLAPYRGRWFFADQLFHSSGPQQLEAAEGADLVMPPHASSLLLLPALEELDGAILDVGCGTGFLALNTGPQAGRSAGIDLNPRCVAYARANAALNGCDATFSVGDFADHAVPAGLRFDHLVFNAPTLPRIDDEGDDGEFGQVTMGHLLSAVVTMAPRVLRPGGSAHILGVVEVPVAFPDAAATIRHRLRTADVTDVTVTAHQAPMLQVTRRQLEQRRLHGNSLLTYGAGQAGRLLDSLAGRGIAAVEVVTIGFRTPVAHPDTPSTERP